MIKIGFTVGVWDLLHEGHINFLSQAKKYCDFLHVGIMTDYWIRVQKGHKNRPTEFKNTIFIDRTPNISTTQIINDIYK